MSKALPHALVLTLVLSLTMVPVVGAAADPEPTEAIENRTDYEMGPTESIDQWTHRPIEELFTSLSCPPCMSNSEPVINQYHADYRDDPSVPFTWIAFHQTNGGAGDDALATQADKDRYNFYSVVGTPDGEFDGGYISSQDHIGAMDESGMRSVANSQLEVYQEWTGDGWRFEVNLTYGGDPDFFPNPFTLDFTDTLDYSIYLFVIEDDVRVYSSYEDAEVITHNAHRATVIDDDQGTLAIDETYTVVADWSIPDSVERNENHADPSMPIHPINPAKISVIAVVYDLDDNDQSSSGSNPKQGLPRAINSATPMSTAYDLQNDIPTVSETIETLKNGEAELMAFFEDEQGISGAQVVWNNQGVNHTGDWNIDSMEVTGDEICDENGVCYSYGNAAAIATLPVNDGETIYYQVMFTDGAHISNTTAVKVFAGTSPADWDDGGNWILWVAGGGGLFVMLILGFFVVWARMPYQGSW